jgi:hypothetical protein
MKAFRLTFLLASILVSYPATIYETNITVETFVGSGFEGVVNGNGLETMFNRPSNMTFTPNGAYVYDWYAGTIRLIKTNKEVSTVVSDFNGYGGMTAATNGDLFCVGGPIVWRIPNGSGTAIKYAGVDVGYLDGPRQNAFFGKLSGIVISKDGNIFVADEQNRRIRRISPDGTVSTFVGSGNDSQIDGRGIFSSFRAPAKMAIDKNDVIYVFDSYLIRRIEKDGQVLTVAGGGNTRSDGPALSFRISTAYSMTVNDSNELFFTDLSSVRVLTADGIIKTVAGAMDVSGFQDGAGETSLFKTPFGLVFISPSELLVSDYDNNRIRLIRRNSKRTIISLSPRLAFGVVLTGTPGSSFKIEYADELSPQLWHEAETIVLPRSPHTWYDESSFGPRKRFYRATLLE